MDTVRIGIVELKNNVKKDRWFVDKDSDTDLVRFYEDIQKFCKAIDEVNIMAQYNYYRFYMNTSPKMQRIIETLRPYDEPWIPLFSKSYFERILLNNASVHIPHNEEHYLLYEQRKAAFDTHQIEYIHMTCDDLKRQAITQFKKDYDFTIENLYNKRKSKYYKRLSLREIIERDTNFFTSLFPIIFTTP